MEVEAGLTLALPVAVAPLACSLQGWIDRALMPGVAFDLPNGVDKPNPRTGLISRLTNIRKVSYAPEAPRATTTVTLPQKRHPALKYPYCSNEQHSRESSARWQPLNNPKGRAVQTIQYFNIFPFKLRWFSVVLRLKQLTEHTRDRFVKCPA